MLIKHTVYLVIITSKDLLTHVLFLLPLETISRFLLKNAIKKKLFEKIRKKQSHTLVSHSFKNSFMLKNMRKKLVKTKLYKYISKGLTLT